MDEIWAGDVLVIGAGAVGTLVATALQETHSVTLMDAQGYGAGQSNHSHGYLHQGYVYVQGGAHLSASLRCGAALWRSLLDAAGSVPQSAGSTIAFSNPVTSRCARATWASNGLPVRVADVPEGLDRDVLRHAYATTEEAHDFTTLYERLAGGLQGVAQLRGQARRIRVRDGRIVGVEVRLVDGGSALLRSHLYLLAAGASNATLMRRATRYRGRAVSRMSFMAIAAGPSLPPMSLILPGNDHYGLFIVSRALPDGGHAWLISNFLSLAYSGHGRLARRLWLAALIRTLGAVAPALRDEKLSWGLYDAPKGELRDQPGVMGGHSFESFGLQNLFALAPTKLTLAPLLAREVDRACRGRLIGLPRTATEVVGTSLPVLPERWRVEQLVPLEKLLEAERCLAAAQALWRPAPKGHADTLHR